MIDRASVARAIEIETLWVKIRMLIAPDDYSTATLVQAEAARREALYVERGVANALTAALRSVLTDLWEGTFQ